MIDDSGAGIWKPQRTQQRELRSLGDLIPKTPSSVDNAHPEPLKMFEVADRVVDSVSMPARVRRGTHAIEDQRVAAVGVRVVNQKMAGGGAPVVKADPPAQPRQQPVQPMRHPPK